MDKKTKKWLQKRADYANEIIHRENLYLAFCGAEKRRVFDCHIENDALVVRDLYRDGNAHPVDGNNSRFFNGYGSEVWL